MAIPTPEWIYNVTAATALLSTCSMNINGVVVIRDGVPVAIGAARSLPTHPTCETEGHQVQPTKMLVDGPGVGGKVWANMPATCSRPLHAVVDAIVDAARHGNSLFGGSLFCVRLPCLKCARLVVSAGIVSVRAHCGYAGDSYVHELFRSMGVGFDVQPFRIGNDVMDLAALQSVSTEKAGADEA